MRILVRVAVVATVLAVMAGCVGSASAKGGHHAPAPAPAPAPTPASPPVVAPSAPAPDPAPAPVLATSTVTTSSGYVVSVTGPQAAVVGVPATYTAVCGPVGQTGDCPYGEFRAFGGTINRLGEGFGVGAIGRYTFRAPGTYQIRYRVGASCPGSPRLACPIDLWLYTVVSPG